METLDNMDVAGVVKDLHLSINEVKGSVGNKLVTLHRDTQFSGVFIRKEHEFEEQLTGTYQRCKFADGCIIDADVARINVDTPYFTGIVDA